MFNSIKDFLDLKDCDDIVITEIETDDKTRTKYIHIKKVKTVFFCPVCGCRMHSKGIIERHFIHSSNSQINQNI